MTAVAIRMLLAIPARLIVLNVAWAALVVWAWFMGYVGFIFTHDVSHLTYLISALLAVMVVAAFGGKQNVLAHGKTWFVMIGLIGNCIGFIVALRDLGGASMTDASDFLKVGKALLGGMSVAFCATLAGAVAALWTSTNIWVLGGAASE